MSRILTTLVIALALFATTAQAGTSLRITITGDASQLSVADNARKSTQAATALAADPRVARLPVTVRIVGSVAQIKGRVYTAGERELVQRIVASLPGVSQVQNGIVTLETFMPTTLGQNAGSVVTNI